MGLYKLTLASLLARKTFVIFAFILIVFPFALPLMTPWETKPSLLEPARAQAAWVLLWVTALGWLLFQGATIGDRWSSDGILEYFKAVGLKKHQQIAQIWLACFTVFSGLAVITFSISTFTAMPSNPIEAQHWVTTNLQYLSLFLLVVAPLLGLAIALGTRISGAAAYAVSISLVLYGLFGIGHLEVFIADNNSFILNLLYVASPHYHLSDLTSRLVFKLGAIPTAEFALIALYFGAIALITIGISYPLYREGK